MDQVLTFSKKYFFRYVIVDLLNVKWNTFISENLFITFGHFSNNCIRPLFQYFLFRHFSNTRQPFFQEESSTPSSSLSSFSSSCLQVSSCQGVLKPHFNFNNSWQGEPCTWGPGAWKLYKPLVQQDNGDHDAQQLLLQQQQGEGGSQKLNGQLPVHGGDVARSPFPTPNTPFSQDPGIPVDLPEGSGMAEFVANMLRWTQDSYLGSFNSFTSPDTLLGLEINQGNGSNATDSMSDESSSRECVSNDCRHHTYDTLKTQLRGGGEVSSWSESQQSNSCPEGAPADLVCHLSSWSGTWSFFSRTKDIPWQHGDSTLDFLGINVH